jgi:hypothetical protein
MDIDDPDVQIAAAREHVLTWLQARQPGCYGSNAQLADGFARFVGMETALELRTQRNPSALAYEARWYDGGQELPEFRKPFCAEQEGDARILACAALLDLDAK